MEVLHNVTEIGDFYNGLNHPGRFDEMADAAATHLSSYTKLEAGWLDPEAVPVHNGGKRTYTLHAIGLSQPPPGGRVAGIRVRAFGSDRYLVIEARLKSDRWDRGFSGSLGIPSEGVVAYEFAPESKPWPRLDPGGPWPPLELRTPTALTVGQSFLYQDARTMVSVRSATAGGFIIELDTNDVAVPFVQELREATAIATIRAAGLQSRSTGTSGQQAWVWRQSPQAGTRVPPGSTVTLQLRVGPIP
jgi:PASTA domain